MRTVFAELVAIIKGQGGGIGDFLGVIAVNVNDGRIDHFAHIAGVDGTARIHCGRRVSNLIIHHHVHRTARSKMRQIRQPCHHQTTTSMRTEGFHDDALARECRVAV